MAAPALLRHVFCPVEPDADLLARFAARCDPDAFAELVRRHGPVVYRIFRRLLGEFAGVRLVSTGCCRQPWAGRVAVLDAPLRVLTEQRQLEAAAERHREATRTGFEPIGLAHRLLNPLRRVLHRSTRGFDRLCQSRIRRRSGTRLDLERDRLERPTLAERAQRVE